MKKRLATVLLCTSLVFSLTGCGDKEKENDATKSSIENINVDTVNDGKITFDYPTDGWVRVESHPRMSLTLIPDNLNDDDEVSIVVSKTRKEIAPLKMMVRQMLRMKKLGVDVNLAEVRTLGDKKIGYIESTMKLTKELLAIMKTDSTIRAQISLAGGVEELLDMPPTKQIIMLVKFDNKLITITGTYNDDAYKKALLKAMITIAKTARLN